VGAAQGHRHGAGRARGGGALPRAAGRATPDGGYQLASGPAQFAHVVGWLTLNRIGLDVFVHPNTGDALVDHRDRALWLGRSYTLNLAALGNAA